MQYCSSKGLAYSILLASFTCQERHCTAQRHLEYFESTSMVAACHDSSFSLHEAASTIAANFKGTRKGMGSEKDVVPGMTFIAKGKWQFRPS